LFIPGLDKFSAKLQKIEEAKVREKRVAEIGSAVRSLETNLALSVLIALASFFAFTQSGSTRIFFVSALKGLAPILTTVVNFVKG
jgi:Na+/serine symporter